MTTFKQALLKAKKLGDLEKLELAYNIICEISTKGSPEFEKKLMGALKAIEHADDCLCAEEIDRMEAAVQ